MTNSDQFMGNKCRACIDGKAKYQCSPCPYGHIRKGKPMTDQLLRYAEFAGIPVFKTVGDRLEKKHHTHPFIYYYPGEKAIYWREENEKYDWNLSTYLGRLAIADAIMQSEKWPEEWIIGKETILGKTEYYVGRLVEEGCNSCDWYDAFVTGSTPIDAVLAAVEEVGKCSEKK